MFLVSLFFLCSLAADTFLWPVPKQYTNGSVTLAVSNPLTFTSVGYSSSILTQAYQRYNTIIFNTKSNTQYLRHLKKRSGAALTQVNVNVSSSDESLQYGFDETYTLDVPTAGAATITAKTVYGALRGIETFSQLIYSESQGFVLPYAPWAITDAPRFPWRGIILDTSRWFMPLSVIEKIVDGMAYTKLNVLHWHVTDSQSFPIVSNTYPQLSGQGAYSQSEIYSQTDVKNLITYAQQRGVRIVPEFDAPGHALSWGIGYPGLVVCPNAQPWSNYCAEPPCGQLDPTNEQVYTVLDGFLGEMAGLFMDNYIHLGADEVNFACWDSAPSIQQYKQQHPGTTDNDLLQNFEDREHSITDKYKKMTLNWEEVLTDFNLKMNKTTILQAWKGTDSVKAIVDAGFQCIASPSSDWYLDCGSGNFITGGTSWCDPFKTWQNVYDYDPTTGLTSSEAQLVIGGEVAVWSEIIDASNVESKIYPRASAAAERLWSPSSVKSATAWTRMNWHRQVLFQRGIYAAPVQPEWCVRNPGYCHD